MQINQHEFPALARAITALRGPGFTTHLMALMREIVEFDCAVILGYRPRRHPIYLYDSITTGRHLLFQRYLTDSYLKDPFYLDLLEKSREGVLSLKELSGKGRLPDDYARTFYEQTGWQDEIALIVEIEESRWIVVYLGYLQNGKGFSTDQISAVKQRFEVISSLCKQHWSRTPFHVPPPSPTNGPLASQLNDAIASFGRDLLSPREQHVAALLVQGLDSNEIAEQLGISLGTVKNHRKRIYASLNIASLGELFQLFLNYLVGSSVDGN